MSGQGDGGEVVRALIAPVSLTLVLGPVTLWLYRGR
jgi:hypothetical protein